MTFPTPHTVGHEVFTGASRDGMGNDIETWAQTVDVKVIAYQPSMVESLNGHTSRVVADVDMATPPTLAVSVRDRFILPGEPGKFEVMAIDDANHGFQGWKPGSVIKLKRVTG